MNFSLRRSLKTRFPKSEISEKQQKRLFRVFPDFLELFQDFFGKELNEISSFLATIFSVTIIKTYRVPRNIELS